MNSVIIMSPSLSRKGAGVFEVVRQLSVQLVDDDLADVKPIGFIDSHFSKERQLWGDVVPLAFPVIGPKKFGYSPELMKYVSKSSANVLHLQALWTYMSLVSLEWSKYRKRSCIITPNGMLEPWALKNSRYKKIAASLFFERSNLESASCIQANTAKEYADIRRLGLSNPICIVPNGITLPENNLSQSAEPSFKRLTYVGRLHPKKGLINFLKGFGAFQNGDLSNSVDKVQVVVAGLNQIGHLQELIRLTVELSLTYRAYDELPANLPEDLDVVFLGPTYDDSKAVLYSKTSAFFLPSLSEGQPMAALEAMSFSLPVIMTRMCNLDAAFNAGVALEIELTDESIIECIRVVATMSDSELKEVGSRARDLVEANYSWPRVSRQIAGVYEWLSDGGTIPDSLELK